MIGKSVEYQNPDISQFGMYSEIIIDKILIDSTNYYLIKNLYGHIDTIRSDKIKSIN